MTLTIKQKFLTGNRCYKAGNTITVRGLMLHSVGCSQPDANVFVRTWNNNGVSACVHAFIDGNTGEVIQTLPWNRRGWHCASGQNGSGNNTHIGVEMCEPACIKYTGGSTFKVNDTAAAKACVQRTYNAAVELFAYLCKLYGLDPLKDGVIISHAEGHKRGIASDHGDPEHLWRGVGLNYTMNTFREAVKAKMNGTSVNVSNEQTTTVKKEVYRVRKSWTDAKTQLGAYTVLKNAKEKADQNHGYSVYDSKGTKIYPIETKTESVPFKVRIKTGCLRIRKAPTTASQDLGYTGEGIFTIIETSPGAGSVKGWGKLKSGKGWISLDYVEKI